MRPHDMPLQQTFLLQVWRHLRQLRVRQTEKRRTSEVPRAEEARVNCIESQSSGEEETYNSKKETGVRASQDKRSQIKLEGRACIET
jgi:hypothetical protein